MNQQSGHLSDAQVEQYGNTVAPEQPEADDREHKIETHLADCGVCRERVLAAQRIRFAPLAVPNMSAGHTARRPGSANPGGIPPGPNCPDEDDLRDLAAGLHSPEIAAKLTQHAAQCDHCGQLLRGYIADFSDEVSDEDQAVLAKLKSSSTDWQQKLVAEMLASSGRSSAKSVKKPFPWRWVLAPAALAACAAIAFAVWYQQRETPEKVARLLGEAYTDNRQLEMRIPYAKHADFHQLRSGEAESLLNKPEALRKAADMIQSQLKKDPDDPKWLLLSARLDLLDWHYRPALTTLNKVEQVQHNDSNEIYVTRAIALYEKAESESEDKQSLGESANLLGKVLQTNPNDRVALFNQAIVCEKLFMYQCALTDYDRFLAVEQDAGWSAEARRHRDLIEEKKTPVQ